ncbi:MAG TPA: hypothetical protein VH482_30210 [Thermomicrobiales bacterium]|jgi:hypothetical protein
MDGVHGLRKRQHTRLWYRRLSASAPSARGSAWPTSARPLSAADEAAWAELLAGTTDQPPQATPPPAPTPAEPAPEPDRSGEPDLPLAATEQTAVLRPQIAEEWRVVPTSAPSLLLSATDLLDARTPGPVLRPGARYRVAGVQNGIVGLHVIDPDGESGLGFCAAVDLICIDNRFAGHKPGRTFRASTNPFRARMQRLTGGLSQATTTLLGAASNSTRLF